MSKDFKIKDKSGRDGILQRGNEEYWIDSGETCHRETKEGFYKAINAGYRGFILYPSGKTFWISEDEEVKEDVAEIPLRVIKQTLDALWFNFSPHLDEIEDCDKQWIYDAIDAYNALLAHAGEIEDFKIVML